MKKYIAAASLALTLGACDRTPEDFCEDTVPTIDMLREQFVRKYNYEPCSAPYQICGDIYTDTYYRQESQEIRNSMMNACIINRTSTSQ